MGRNNNRDPLLLSDSLIIYTKSMRLESPIYQHFPAFSYVQIVRRVRPNRAFRTVKSCDPYVHIVRRVRANRAPIVSGGGPKPPSFRINNIENTGLAGFLGSVSSNRAG